MDKKHATPGKYPSKMDTGVEMKDLSTGAITVTELPTFTKDAADAAKTPATAKKVEDPPKKDEKDTKVGTAQTLVECKEYVHNETIAATTGVSNPLKRKYYRDTTGRVQGQCIGYAGDAAHTVILNCNYRDNVLHGRYEEFYPDSRVKNIRLFENGAQVGDGYSYEYPPHLSKMTYLTVTNSDNKVVAKTSYLNGIIVCQHVTYDPNTGKVCTEAKYDPKTHHEALLEEAAYSPRSGRRKGKHASYENGVPINAIVYDADAVAKVEAYSDKKNRDCVIPPGRVVVWKICYALIPSHYNKDQTEYVYVELEVPEDAERVTVYAEEDVKKNDEKYKSRVSKAKVLSITGVRSGRQHNEAYSWVFKTGAGKFRYVVGEMAVPDKFDPDPRNECSHGISVHRYKDQCDYWISK